MAEEEMSTTTTTRSKPSEVAQVKPTFDDADDLDRVLEEKEQNARDASEKRAIFLFIVDGFASMKVFCRYLITANSLLGAALTAGAIVFVHYRTVSEAAKTATANFLDKVLLQKCAFVSPHTHRTHQIDQKDRFIGDMDWILLAFAVVFPLSAAVRFAFSRREQALKCISKFKACALSIYLCHATWDWAKADSPDSGWTSTNKNRLKHSDVVVEELVGMGDELCRYLTLPTSSLGRHREVAWGRKEAAACAEASYLLFDSLLTMRLSALVKLTESLKLAGVPAGEASRTRQWERYLALSVEELRMIKTYRTPQALRSFANLFTLLLPPFYAPSFVQLAHDVNSIGLGVAFGVMTSIALTALYESVQVLEDPFVANLALDGIDVYEELAVLHWRQLMTARKRIFPKARPIQEEDYLDEKAREEKKKNALKNWGKVKMASKLLASQRELMKEREAEEESYRHRKFLESSNSRISAFAQDDSMSKRNEKKFSGRKLHI